jgi:hypothetical protein
VERFCPFARASSKCSRHSRFPVLALQQTGELSHRRTGDKLDRHPVCAQRERQLLSVGSAPGEEGEAAPPAEREVELRRVGAGCAPAMLALDDPPPQEDSADDGADRLTRRAAAADEARRRFDRARGVKPALAVGLRRRVQGWRGRPPPVAVSLAAGDRCTPRQPDGAVDGRAEAEALPARDDEPTPPADDRLRVVRCARRPDPTPVPSPARGAARPALLQAAPPAARAEPAPRAARPSRCEAGRRSPSLLVLSLRTV